MRDDGDVVEDLPSGRVLATIAVATRPAPLDRVADMRGDVDREVTKRNREALAISVASFVDNLVYDEFLFRFVTGGAKKLCMNNR